MVTDQCSTGQEDPWNSHSPNKRLKGKLKGQIGIYEIWPKSVPGIFVPLPNIWDASELYILQTHSDGQERFWDSPTNILGGGKRAVGITLPVPDSLKCHLSADWVTTDRGHLHFKGSPKHSPWKPWSQLQTKISQLWVYPLWIFLSENLTSQSYSVSSGM